MISREQYLELARDVGKKVNQLSMEERELNRKHEEVTRKIAELELVRYKDRAEGDADIINKLQVEEIDLRYATTKNHNDASVCMQELNTISNELKCMDHYYDSVERREMHIKDHERYGHVCELLEESHQLNKEYHVRQGQMMVMMEKQNEIFASILAEIKRHNEAIG
jgi:lipoate synthase